MNSESEPRSWTAPFVDPLLRARDQLEARESSNGGELDTIAFQVLANNAGPSGDTPTVGRALSTFGVAANHTHYADGYALLLSVAGGMTIAAQPSSRPVSTVVFAGEDRLWELTRVREDAQLRPWWTTVVESAVRTLVPEGRSVDIAVASTIAPSMEPAYRAALGVASSRALRHLMPAAEEDVSIAKSILSATEGPLLSCAYTIAAARAQPGKMILVDCGSGEHLNFEAPEPDALAFALVDTGGRLSNPGLVKTAEKRAAELVDAIARLKLRGYPDLESPGELVHRDLDDALNALPRRLRPALRLFVRENQLVQRIVGAVRKNDWQLLGGLLNISHSTWRDEWGTTCEESDFVVELAEQMTAEGIYGASSFGDHSGVLLVGLPYQLPQFLDRLRGDFETRFGVVPEAHLL